MERKAQIVTVIGLCGLMAGCIPVPKKSVAHYGVEGRLTDASNGEPIAKARVSVAVDGREFSKTTNRSGEFKVAPEMHHFWTWLGGPMWMDATRSTVNIASDGYVSYHKTLVVRSESADVPVPPDQDQLKGNYIALGNVGMKKREQDGAANRSQPARAETNQASAAAGSGR